MRHIKGKDLNLLTIFGALWRERNVTRAALAIGTTQPALSRALSRLRVEFADPLFVRASRGITPTDRAAEIAKVLMPSLEAMEAVYAPSDRFNPATLEMVVTIATSDYFEAIAATNVVPRLLQEAPGLTLNFRSVQGAIPKEAIERGDIDLVVAGIFEQLPEGYFHQKLFVDRYRSAVRSQHPLATINAAQFAELAHILVTPKGDLTGIVDEALKKIGSRRRIAIGSSNFLAAGWMLAHTDYVLSAPGLLIDSLKQFLPIRDFATPVSIPKLEIFQIWHARTHQDPAHKWLRQRLQEYC